MSVYVHRGRERGKKGVLKQLCGREGFKGADFEILVEEYVEVIQESQS